MNLIDKAEAIARKAHEGQFRRDGVTPYITHPERVVARLRAQGVTDEVTLAVAWLHDTGEGDAANPVDPLMQLPSLGMNTDVCYNVDLLTRDDSQHYDSYLSALKDESEPSHAVARTVKIADILDNLSDAPTEKQIIKYAKALLYLHNETP